jgi:hypothetical protein
MIKMEGMSYSLFVVKAYIDNDIRMLDVDSVVA